MRFIRRPRPRRICNVCGVDTRFQGHTAACIHSAKCTRCGQAAATVGTLCGPCSAKVRDIETKPW